MRRRLAALMERAGPRAGRGGLGGESGQAMTEYALLSFFMIVGGAAGLVFFLPAAINAYDIYIKGFFLVLGLPVP